MEFFMLGGIGILIPLIVKFVFGRDITILEMAIQMLASILFMSLALFIGKSTSLHDVEVWNGQLTAMERDNDSHMESYSCRCRSVCSGSSSSRTCTMRCDTCWRRVYTVDWTFDTTVGDFRVGSRRAYNAGIWNVTDPQHYQDAYIGMPVSREFGYQNYLRSTPRSLFNTENRNISMWDEEDFPAYPRVYNYTDIDRVVSGAGATPDPSLVTALDEALDECLIEMGPEHEVNIVVVIAGTENPDYRYALETAWRGGKKNDVIVVIGAPNYPAIDWVDTITLAGSFGNDLLVDEMSLSLREVGTLEDATLITEVIQDNVREHFTRVSMEEFEYLKDEVRPGPVAITITAILSLIFSGWLTWMFFRYNISFKPSRTYYG